MGFGLKSSGTHSYPTFRNSPILATLGVLVAAGFVAVVFLIFWGTSTPDTEHSKPITVNGRVMYYSPLVARLIYPGVLVLFGLGFLVSFLVWLKGVVTGDL